MILLTKGEPVLDDDGETVAIALRDFERTWWEPTDFKFTVDLTDKVKHLINTELVRRRNEAMKNALYTEWVV